MHRRRIQKVAGTTYSVSLPKDWVVANSLKEKDELTIVPNGSSLILTTEVQRDSPITSITLSVEDHPDILEHVMFSVYYLGVGEIVLKSKTELTKERRSGIRRALASMSGTEVSFEDKQKIVIRVLLDSGKVDVIQTLYRICLLLDGSLACLQEGADMDEMRMNEEEIDRLYHLITKMVTLSLLNAQTLRSSGIGHALRIPSLVLISKRLENIGDILFRLAKSGKHEAAESKEVFAFLRTEIARSIRYVLKKAEAKKFDKIFSPAQEDYIAGVLNNVQDPLLSRRLGDAVRYLFDVQEVLVNMSFYDKLIFEKEL